MRVCIVIPAYEPGGEFVPYAQEVLAAGLGPVLVVDDGSGEGRGLENGSALVRRA